MVEEDDLLVCNTKLHECDTQGMDGKPTPEEEDWCQPLIQHLMDRR